ncbi:hypothetical protein CRG98_043523 [Punica granatum]|uniref:Uncharacterized protein n=1 Tax=Punica granatum TaxID=22663 RepID=A0A2I0HWI6_PUNGR|nr:hypothetical protein CRG98_043523 [Punica granatum]
MEYSSGPLEDVENRPLSDSGFNADALSLPMRHWNRSGPLRTVRSKPAFYRLMGGSLKEVMRRLLVIAASCQLSFVTSTAKKPLQKTQPEKKFYPLEPKLL